MRRIVLRGILNYYFILSIIVVWIFYLSIKVTSQVVEVFFYLMNGWHVSLTRQRNFTLHLPSHSVHFKSIFYLIFEVDSQVLISSGFITLHSLFLRHLRDHYLPTERKKE